MKNKRSSRRAKKKKFFSKLREWWLTSLLGSLLVTVPAWYPLLHDAYRNFKPQYSAVLKISAWMSASIVCDLGDTYQRTAVDYYTFIEVTNRSRNPKKILMYAFEEKVGNVWKPLQPVYCTPIIYEFNKKYFELSKPILNDVIDSIIEPGHSIQGSTFFSGKHNIQSSDKVIKQRLVIIDNDTISHIELKRIPKVDGSIGGYGEMSKRIPKPEWIK